MTNEIFRISHEDATTGSVAACLDGKAPVHSPEYLVIVVAKRATTADTTYGRRTNTATHSRPRREPGVNGQQPDADVDFTQRLRGVLQGWEGALWRRNTTDFVVILPVHNNKCGSADALQEGILFADKILKAVRAETATVCSCRRDRIPAMLAEASHRLAVAAAVGLRGAFATEHLSIETALVAEPRLAEQCARLVAPLRNGPDLLLTLEALYQCDLDRSKTAKKLFVHRHTVNYRLSRIESICGISPTSARGIQLFKTALAALRICEMSSKPTKQALGNVPDVHS